MNLSINAHLWDKPKISFRAGKDMQPVITIESEEVINLFFPQEDLIKTLHEAIHNLEEEIKIRDNKPEGGEQTD